MKIIYSAFIVLIFIISNGKLLSQCNTETLLAKLNSDNRVDIYEAIDSLIICNTTEAISALESKFDSEQGITLKSYYLDALYKLNAENILDLTNTFIDEVDNLSAPNKIKLFNKLFAVDILFEFDDYSKADLVIDIVDYDTLDVQTLAINLLEKIIQNVPSLEEGAKSRLISQSLNARYGWDRSRALDILVDNYGNEVIDVVLEISENDLDMAVRMKSLRHLVSLNYGNLNSFLIQKIYVDEDPSIRINIAESILTIFGKPWDLKAIIVYLPNETDTVAFSVIEYYKDEFIPPEPDSTVTPYQMSVNLLVYNDSLYTYGWITNQTLYNNYKTRLTNIKKYISKNQLTNAVNEINSMLNSIELQQGDPPTLTDEGYVFLHYHLIYIKDRIT